MLTPKFRPLRKLVLAARSIEVPADGEVFFLELSLLGRMFRCFGW